MKTRRDILLPVAVFVLAGACFALWRHQTRVQTLETARGAVPQIPDTHLLPREFQHRIEKASAHAQKDDADPLRALDRLARLYLANGFPKEADRLLHALHQLEPTEPRWAYFLADLEQQDGRTGDALAHLAETLEIAPDYAPAHLRRAELLLKMDRLDEAEQHYRARLELHPKDPYARLGAARISLHHGEARAAREQLESLVRDAPDFSSAWNVLAELVARGGDEARAAELRRKGHAAGRFREAADPWLEELHADCFDPYRLEVLGAIRMQAGDLANSLPYFEKALKLAPADASIHDSLADVYEQLKRFDDARRTLQRGIEANPDNARLHLRLAELDLKLGRRQDSLETVEQGLARAPDSPELHNQLGVCLDAFGRSEEAIAAYRRALEINPNLAEAMLNLGKSLIDTEGAAGFAWIERALEARPNKLDALVLLTDRAINAGHLDQAERYLKTMQRVAPEAPAVRTMLAAWHLKRGNELARSGDAAGAIEAFKAGIAADPEVATLHGNLGVMLAQAGRFNEAVPLLERLVALEPSNLTGYLYLGGVLLKSERFAEGRQVLSRGRDLARRTGDRAMLAQFEQALSQTPATAAPR